MFSTNNDNCPVKSFVKYLSKRNKTSDCFFQQPKDHFTEDMEVWYENRPLSKYKLGI